MKPLKELSLYALHGSTSLDHKYPETFRDELPELLTYDAFGVARQPNLGNHPPKIMKPIKSISYISLRGLNLINVNGTGWFTWWGIIQSSSHVIKNTILRNILQQ